MNRRDFAQKSALIFAAIGLGSVQADVIDRSKKSKVVEEEENRITIKILGFDSQQAGDKGKLTDFRLWACNYELKRADGTITTRTTGTVLSNKKSDSPPMRYMFDLS